MAWFLVCCDVLCMFFFFKQKTAYEIPLVTGVQTCALPILPGMNDPRLLSFSGCGKFVGAVSSGQAASGNILPRFSAGTREASGRSSHFSHALAGPAIATRLFELVE